MEGHAIPTRYSKIVLFGKTVTVFHQSRSSSVLLASKLVSEIHLLHFFLFSGDG
jgi:hypothetical protein